MKKADYRLIFITMFVIIIIVMISYGSIGGENGLEELLDITITPTILTTEQEEATELSEELTTFPEPEVLLSDEVVLIISSYDNTLPTSVYDLDNNEIALSEPQENDIKMGFTQGGSYQFLTLILLNGASGNHYGTTEPGFQGCNQITNIFTMRSILETFLGSYACLLTNEGNMAQVFIADEDCEDIGNCIITLQFKVWSFTETD